MDETSTVLVVTGIDTTADSVIDELHERDVPVARFDLADFPGSLRFATRFVDGRLSGELQTPSRTVDLTQVRSVYWRRPNLPEFPELPEQDATFIDNQIRYGFSGSLQVLPDCLYVNHPRRAWAAEYKMAQLQTATALGFNVPPTLVSNNLDEVSAFVKEHGPVVYKPMAWSAYTVDDTAYAVWVREVNPDELDESIAFAPHLFQTRVDKVADVRVTVVGDQVFCARIDSPCNDWRERYDLIESYTIIDPPYRLVEQLRSYLHHFGLVYGCFDFGLDHNGAWWWYECNPAGEWGWIESETGMGITDAFADVLTAGRDST